MEQNKKTSNKNRAVIEFFLLYKLSRRILELLSRQQQTELLFHVSECRRFEGVICKDTRESIFCENQIITTMAITRGKCIVFHHQLMILLRVGNPFLYSGFRKNGMSPGLILFNYRILNSVLTINKSKVTKKLQPRSEKSI
jgi:hypothetical protein